MTDCLSKSGEYAERLLAYSAGRLDARESQELLRHMEICSACASFRKTQAAVWSVLDRWEAPPVSADFNRRLYARIEAAEAAPWYRRWLDAITPVFHQPALPLTAAAAVIITGFLLDHPARLAPVSQTAAQHSVVSATDAEQVEKTLDDLEMLRQFDVSSDQNSDDKEKVTKSM